MGQHRIGVRVNLSPAAERRFLQACKEHGGQTRFIEEAIENYVRQLDLMEKLNTIEGLLRQLVGSDVRVSKVDKTDAKQETEGKAKDAQNEKPDILDPFQREAALSTLRAFMGGEDV